MSALPFSFSIWTFLKILAGFFLLMILYKAIKFGISLSMLKKRYLQQGIRLVKFFGLNFLKDMSRLLDQHGDVMYPIKEAIKKHPDSKALLVQMGPMIAVSLTGPEYIKEFNNRIISDYDRMSIQKIMDPLMKNGILTLTGEDWKLHRKVLSDSFRFDLFERNIIDNHLATVEFFENLSPQEMENFVPREQLKLIFSAINGQTFFGDNVGKHMIDGKSCLSYLIGIFDDAVKSGKNPLMFLPMPEFLKKKLVPPYGRYIDHSKKLKRLLHQIIQETRERIEANPNLKGKNIIEGLLEAQKQFKDRTKTFDDESIGGEFITLLFAGVDVTSVLLSNTLYYLSLYPDLVAELVEEIQHAIPERKLTSISQLNSLELMHSTLKEVLRLHPPAVIVSKEAIRDTQVLDIKIKKGDYVGVAIQANHANPKYWEEPEKFNPRRFMKGASAQNMEPFAFLAFSTGMRNCIGQHFAMIQAKLVLATFLTTFDFKLAPGYKMKLGFKVLYEPMDSVKLILNRKEK